jgi:hypothetical protein
MGALIWLIVIVMIIYRTVQKNPELKKQVEQKKYEAMRSQTTQQRTVQPQTAQTRTMQQRTVQPQTAQARTTQQRTAQLQTTQVRMMQQRTVQSQTAQARTIQQRMVQPEAAQFPASGMPDIVTRAKANSARYAADETLRELESEHRHSEHVSPAGEKHTNIEETKRAHISPADSGNVLEEESLLGSVEDLMVKGYDGNLSFDRDFLGEAMDMLNSFTL